MAIEKTVILNVETKEATKNIDLLSRSFEDAYGEIQPLTGRMGELEDQLYELANAGKQGTDEFKTLAAEVGRMKKTIQQTDAQVDGLAMTTSQKLGGALGGVTSGFELVQGAMGAMGAESENVQKALLKVQSAMAIAQGVQGIKESIPAFKAMGVAIQESATAQKILNFVMKQNPIMLIVSAVAALVGAYALLSGSENDETEKQKALTEEKIKAAQHQKALAKDIQESSKHIAEESIQFISLTTKLKQTNANSKERRDLIRQINGEYGTHLKNLQNEKDFQNQVNGVVKDYIKFQTNKYALMKNEAYMQYNLEKQFKAQKKLNELNKQVEEKGGHWFEKDIANVKKDIADSQKAMEELAMRATQLTSSQEKLTDSGKKYVEQQKEVVKVDKQTIEDKKELQKQEEDLKELQKKAEQDLLDEINAIASKRLEAQKKGAEDRKAQAAKDEQDIYDNQIGFLEAQITADENNIAAKKDLLDIQKDLELQNKELTEGEIAAIEAKYRKQKEDLDISAEEKEKARKQKHRDELFDAAKAGLTAIGDLAVLFAGKSKAQQKKAFQVQKAVNIATATIDTFKGATTAFTSAGNPILGAVFAAAVVAAGLANISKIASTKFDEGAGGGGGGAGGAPSVPNVQAANFNVVGAGGANQLAQLSSNPIKAYVVSGEVSSAQSLDRNIVKNATI
jgi:DNA repair exonuclease SbcCD ATPase subunit